MKASATHSTYSHPLDVLRFISEAQIPEQRCALVSVTGTKGGGVRAPGALMGVTENGECAGHVSNGCVDADIIVNAQAAIREGAAQELKYGEGSPFLDIRLPCGGSLDLIIVPNPSRQAVKEACTALEARRPVGLQLSLKEALEVDAQSTSQTGWAGDAFGINCLPKIRLRIAGRGAEPVALAKLALAADIEVSLQSPDEICLAEAASLGIITEYLVTPSIAPLSKDDPWTAFVLMFHDHDWETELLKEALSGKAFYIGALGSKATHIARCQSLAEIGVVAAQIDRVRGPIGVVPATRNASMLAVSTLAEVVQVWQEIYL